MSDSITSIPPTQEEVFAVGLDTVAEAVDSVWEANKIASHKLLQGIFDTLVNSGPMFHETQLSQIASDYSICVEEAVRAARWLSFFGIVEYAEDDYVPQGESRCECFGCVARRVSISFPMNHERIRTWVEHRVAQQREREAKAAEVRERARTVPQDRGHGSVYLVRAGERYKVGIARDVARRLNQLRSGQSPFPIELVHVASGSDYREQEVRLHKRFAHFRVHGEWFEFDEEAVQSVISEMNTWAEGQ